MDAIRVKNRLLQWKRHAVLMDATEDQGAVKLIDPARSNTMALFELP